ncbi:molybdotransferase-like divisome protein Glp [Salinactinospora qingdaonensis]|uniref:Molybdopterin molybdenumtransferase n=1 Tax=Salinactinospora qingdaonensis TaxID=702744 RepID=A0ABP7FPG0_9ACTN
MKTVEQHITDLVDLVQPLEPRELDLLDAHGAVLAEPVTSPVALPGFDNSSMDGYAVRAADVAGASEAAPVSLSVVADIPAGSTSTQPVPPGGCARIMTGAPLPTGATAVVPVEWTDGGTTEVAIRRPAAEGNAVRRAGEDVRQGSPLLQAGVRVGAAELSVLAAVGCGSVSVRPRPRVAVLSTGEELVEPGTPIGPGQIWESNSFMLTGAARDVGCEAQRHGFIGDEPAEVLSTLERVIERADIVVTTGGVSMGAYDVVKEVLSNVGTVRFEQVAVQPGKPQGFGTVGDAAVPIVTLPGNPVSSFVSFYLFVLPALRRLRGLAPDPLPTVRAQLTAPVHSPEGRRSYLRGVLEYGRGSAEGAIPTVTPASRQGSHQLSALAGTNALIVVPEATTELPKDSLVDVLTLPLGEG